MSGLTLVYEVYAREGPLAESSNLSRLKVRESSPRCPGFGDNVSHA
jgi:hypothetical protein